MRRCKAVTWENGYRSKQRAVEGLFHQWASNYEEFENGPGNFTVALIELDNGKIVECLSDTVVFLDRENPGADWLRYRFNRTT